MDPITMLLLLGLGAFIGLLVGLTSVGSGALLTPILLLDFSSVVTGAAVVGTSTVYGTVTKIVASAKNFWKRQINSGYAFFIAITGVPTAAIGAFFTTAIINSNLFSPLLAALLIVLAFLIIYDTKIKEKTVKNDPKMDRKLRLKGMFVGLYVGLIAGLTSVSTGSLMVASLILFMRFKPHTAVNIAIFEGGIILLAASVVQTYLGNVNFLAAGLLIIGGIPTILIGNYYKDKVNARLLSYGVAGLILLESARTISQYLWGKKFFIF